MDSHSAYLIWLGSMVLAIVLLIIGLMGAALRRSGAATHVAGAAPRARRAWIVWAAASLIPALLLAGDALERARGRLSPTSGTLLLGGTMAVLMIVCCWLGVRSLARSQVNSKQVSARTGVVVWLAFVLLNGASSALCAMRFDNELLRATELQELNPNDGIEGTWAMVSAQDVRAATDRGRPVRMFTPPGGVALGGGPSNLSSYERHRVIEVAETDNRANCHGWTFTGGRYLMVGEDVELILQDNGYALVKSPAVGDLVVYRNEQRGIEHTGVVKFIDDRGLVIVESKWATQGRFLHPPKEYDAATFEYYRSSRGGHLLQLFPGDPEAGALPPASSL